ncbi:MAG: BON domain-containing protein [Proteobacteria bacterium]|nr:MAG: BON domain-containing protein [Pseudomonadota bacterium]
MENKNNDHRIYTRRSHPSRPDGDLTRWEASPDRPHEEAPSSFDYRRAYDEPPPAQSSGYIDVGDGFGRGPLFAKGKGRFGDISRYANGDDHYAGRGELRYPEHREKADLTAYGRERARRFEQHEGPGEGMMDLVRGFFGVGPKNYKRADDRILEDANEALFHDPHLDASEIELSVQDGVIELRGTVSDRWSKWRAEDALDSITGVHDVQNKLTIAKQSYAPEEAPGHGVYRGIGGGLAGTIGTGGFNNSVVVHPEDEL